MPKTSALAVGCAATFLWTAVFADSTRVVSCEITDTEVARILELSFREFDQNSKDGWGSYHASKCYQQVAPLLRAYISRYPERVDEHYMLPFSRRTDVRAERRVP